MIFERFGFLVGEVGLEKLQAAKVAVVGVGGVGGITAISLARSGVGTIILCDFDVVELTNINRQMVASTVTVGQKKTDVLARQIKEINPECNVIALCQKVDEALFDHQPDFVIDAIDDVKSKIALITECLNRNIFVVSSMGAAKKMDPSKISVTKLSKTTYDPIAKILRNNFRKQDFPVVSSTEAPLISNLGSYMPVVATFGLFLSDFVIKEILRR